MLKKTKVLLAVLAAVFLSASVSGCAGMWRKYHEPEYVLKMIDKKVEKLELNLTDVQKAKLEEVKKRVADHMNYRNESMSMALKALNEEAAKDTPDFTPLVKKLKEINATRQGGMDAIAESFNDFYMSLDPAQKKKVAGALKEKAEKIEKWHGK